jgi:pyruvate-ferredoxin/flavodoxin oxidoreductase
MLAAHPALEALEALVCDGFVHSPGAPPSAAAARRWNAPGPGTRNAFGRPVQEETGAGPGGSVAVATGMTLGGLRATAFLGGDELVAVHDDLRAAAERLVPLVIHASVGAAGHSATHAVAGAGCFLVHAASAQEALDWSLVARWLAERALVPGILATDGDQVERLRLPDPETVRSYLGHPDEPVASPTESQRLLFGSERPRLLRWFDAERPVATGGTRSPGDAARARTGRRVFFWNHLPDLASEAMRELARLTGRELSFVSRHQLEGAECVLVSQGATLQSARAAADLLRRGRGWKVGVLGIHWLRPFPARQVAEALAGHSAVAVIEVSDDPFAAEAPLLREVESAAGVAGRWSSATCGAEGPDPAGLAELCARLRQPDPPRHIELDRPRAERASGLPRRDALMQALLGAYPELDASAAPEAEPTVEGIRSVAAVGAEPGVPEDAPQRLVEGLATEAAPFLRGTLRRPEPGVPEAWELRLRAGAKDFPDPGPRAPVAVAWISTLSGVESGATLPEVELPDIERGGHLLLASDGEVERVWAELPPAWRASIRGRELQVWTVGAAFENGAEALRACLRGEEPDALASGSLREVPWRELRAPDQLDRELPGVVRRIQRVRPAHDSLPRFWGEVVQPGQAAGRPALADPQESSGAVPAGASALQPSAGPPRIAVLDAEACVGCGRCWSACPDSALGVTACGTEALLTAASHLAGTTGPAADALRRAHRHLAGRLARAGSVSPDACRDAWDWLVKKLALPDEERPAHEAAFAATAEVVARLQPAVTSPFFQEPEKAKQGSGQLLVLAVDARACLGCGLCVAVCPEAALQSVERTPERVAGLEETWRLWEELPDTPPAALAHAAEQEEVGPLAAALLSRHCGNAQLGSASGEPGSGERLAGRLVTGLVEHHAQQRVAGLVASLEERRSELEERARARLGESLSAADMDTLAAALVGVTGGTAELTALGEQLDAVGARATFDRRAVLRLVRTARQLETERHRLVEGEDGLGRARFGVVVNGESVGAWAGRHPLHPFYAPLTLAPTAQGAELARGIARGLATQHVELVRSLRRAALELEDPPDRSAQLEEVAGLGWDALDAELRAACPPLLLLADDAALLEQGFESLTRLLASDLPVKIVLLDGGGRLGAAPEPALVAAAHRSAFVLASSLAHPDHLARGLLDALAWPGPAFVHLHAPSPRRHGFAPDATLERARLAVEARAHVLFRYDPRAEGAFGLRASLDGNPAPDQDWGELSFPEWAAGETRFAAHFEPAAADAPPLAEWLARPRGPGPLPSVESEGRRLRVSEAMASAAAQRLAVWQTLRELTGGLSPFTERIRAELADSVEDGQRAALALLKADTEAQLAGARASSDHEILGRLTERLMLLAGYAPREEAGGEGA